MLDAFAVHKVTGEGIEHDGLVTLDVPPHADHRVVKALLEAGESDGRWHFEEGCVGPDW